MSGVSWPRSAPNPPPNFWSSISPIAYQPTPPIATPLARRLSGESGGSPTAWVSARTAERLPELLSLIDANLPEDALIDSHFSFPLTELTALNLIHSGARVLAEKFTEDACEIHAEVPESLLRRLSPWRKLGTDTP